MLIGLINLVIPFFLIAYGVKSVQSNLAAILMSTTPLSSTILGHFYTKNEKFNFAKTVGILIGFAGIVYLFSDIRPLAIPKPVPAPTMACKSLLVPSDCDPYWIVEY